MAMTNGHLTARAGPWGVSYAANLTPNKRTGLGGWTADQFIRTMRTGKHLGVGRPVLRISARCLRGSNRSSQSKTRSRRQVRRSSGDDSCDPTAVALAQQEGLRHDVGATLLRHAFCHRYRHVVHGDGSRTTRLGAPMRRRALPRGLDAVALGRARRFVMLESSCASASTV